MDAPVAGHDPENARAWRRRRTGRDKPGFPGCRLPKADLAPFQRRRQDCHDRNAAATSSGGRAAPLFRACAFSAISFVGHNPTPLPLFHPITSVARALQGQKARKRWASQGVVGARGFKGRASLSAERPGNPEPAIGELCAEHEISQGQYYQWRDLSSIIDQRLVMADILLPFWKWIEL